MKNLHGGVYTPSELHRSARRLNRRAAELSAVLALLHQGDVLILRYEGGRPNWTLSGGRSVPAEIASILVNNALVIPAGDALFEGISQTWKFAH